MGSPISMSLPAQVAPGQIVDLSVNLVAPAQAGQQQAFWMLQAPGSLNFGVGSSYNQPIWVKIRVAPAPVASTTSTPFASETLTTTSTAPPETPAGESISFDLGRSACAAQWANRDLLLPCPGSEGTSSGSVLALDRATLEDGTVAAVPSILILPGSSADAEIQGLFPDYTVQAGDRFRASVGCEQGASSCSVLFSLAFLDGTGTLHDLWSIGEFYDDQYFNLDLDLSQLEGEGVRFILSVSALGSPAEDRALWVNPRIVHLSVPTSTPVESPTPTLVPASATTPPPAVSTATAIPPLPAATPAQGSGIPSLLSYLQKFVEAVVSFFQQLFGR